MNQSIINAVNVKEVAHELLSELEGAKCLFAADSPEPGPGEDEAYLDFRVQWEGEDTDDFVLHTGDAQYDTDHRGYWGAGTIGPDDDEDSLIAALEGAIEEALDHAGQTI